MEMLKDKWQQSYLRAENFIFYPKDEAVKFLSRFVRKRVGVNKFIDIIDFSRKKPVRGLDFGCGIGRLAILMKEWGIDAYGMDISAHALKTARELAESFGFAGMKDKFVLDNGAKLSFASRYFNIIIADSVLDSMPFKLAVKLVKEIERVTVNKGVFFLSLICADGLEHPRGFIGEEKVKTLHEQGTIQSYYNWEKIRHLIAETKFKIIWAQLISSESLVSSYRSSRYYLVLKKGSA